MTRKQYAGITLEVAYLIFLNKHENAPPIKSGALYQNTVPLPQKAGNFDRNCLPFYFAQMPLASGLFVSVKRKRKTEPTEQTPFE